MTMMNLKTNATVTKLRYQIQRYQDMGNGIMCQALQKQLDKLIVVNGNIKA